MLRGEDILNNSTVKKDIDNVNEFRFKRRKINDERMRKKQNFIICRKIIFNDAIFSE